MSTTINFPYTTDSNYTFDSSKIEVTGGVAKLKLEESSSLTFTEPFTSDTGFTYNSSLAEFTGGLVRQKSQIPANSILGITYTTNQNAAWVTSGAVTGVINGTATVSGGKLVCTGTSQKGAHYDLADVENVSSTGAIKFRYTPNYTTGPSVNINMVFLHESDLTNENRLGLTHSPSGNTLRFWASDSSATAVYTAAAIGAAWNPTSGTEYEFELNWDSTTGTVRVFIDGVLHGTLTSAGAWTRTGTADRLAVGATAEVYNLANASFDDVVVYSTVQHTSGYTPGYTVPENIYAETSVTLPAFDHNTSNQGVMIALSALTTTEANAPRTTWRVGAGNFQYWNGSSWSDSDGSYAQSSPKTDVNTNIAALDVSDETDLQVKVHFLANNTTQQNIDNLEVTYEGQTSYPTDNPTIITNTSFKTTELESFTATETKTGSDEIKYVVNASGQGRYVTGGSAANSNGTYAEASTQTEMDSDIENIITARKIATVTAFLHSDDGSTTPELDLLSILYNAALEDPNVPTLVEVEGFIYDPNGPVASQDVRVRPFQAGYFNQGIFHKYAFDTIATTDADGFFEGLCYYQGAGKFWEFKIGSQSYKVALLDQAEMNLKDAPTFEAILS